jgi:hypothetical protein
MMANAYCWYALMELVSRLKIDIWMKVPIVFITGNQFNQCCQR